MVGCVVNNRVYSKVDDFMSIFRIVLDKLFIEKDNSVNAKIVMAKLKEKEISIDKVKAVFSAFPEGEWNIKVFLDNVEKLNEVWGISDEEIRGYCVSEVSAKDVVAVRYRMLIDSMVEYSKFSTEFYDALKYNNVNGLSVARLKLLNEFMLVFSYLKKLSEQIYKTFEHKKFSEDNLNKLNKYRLPIEFLMLRVLYVSINLKDANDTTCQGFAELLGKERISLMYQKAIIPKFS